MQTTLEIHPALAALLFGLVAYLVNKAMNRGRL